MLNGSWQLPRWPRGGGRGNHSGPEPALPPSRTRALNPGDGSDRSNHYTHTLTHTLTLTHTHTHTLTHTLALTHTHTHTLTHTHTHTHTHLHTHSHRTGFVLNTDAAEGHLCVCPSTTEGAGDDRLGWRAP